MTRLRSSCLDIRCRFFMLFRISSILRICSTCLLISLSILVAKIMMLCVKTCRNHKKMNLKEKIMVNVHVMRGRLATSICLGFRQVPSNGDVTSSTFFCIGTCREFFRLYGDALITKNVLMQIWLNR